MKDDSKRNQTWRNALDSSTLGISSMKGVRETIKAIQTKMEVQGFFFSLTQISKQRNARLKVNEQLGTTANEATMQNANTGGPPVR